MKELPIIIYEIAEKYRANVSRDTENCDCNSGGSAGRNIWLGEFDDDEIELAAFFHELGHVLSDEYVLKRGKTFTKLSGEGLAWELGFGISFEHGYEWDYNSHVMKWAREQFRTYKHE